jgi:hypothetical protein
MVQTFCIERIRNISNFGFFLGVDGEGIVVKEAGRSSLGT